MTGVQTCALPIWIRPYLLQEELAFTFKDNWGEGGMSARLWRMEVGELDAVWQLCREGFCSKGVFFPWAFWSTVKFARRLTIWGVRRLFRALKSKAGRFNVGGH